MKFRFLLAVCLFSYQSECTEDFCTQVHSFNADGVIDAITRIPNSIGYSALLNVFSDYSFNRSDEICRAKVASMRNKAGQIVTPSIVSAQSAVRSRANALLYESSCPGFGMCAEIFDSDESDVWPITAMTYLIVPMINTNKSCAQMRATRDYIAWVLTSDKAKTLARQLQWAEMPDQIAQLGVTSVDRMICLSGGNRSMLVKDFPQVQASLKVRGSGSTMQRELQQALANSFYVQEIIVTAIDVSYNPSGSGQGLQELMDGAHRERGQQSTVDFAGSEALVNPLEPAVVDRRLTMIPVFAGAVAIIYSSSHINNLILTRDLVNSIFLGRVASWDDPAFRTGAAGVGVLDSPNAAFVRVVRRDGSGTTETFTRTLYSFAGLPIPANYSLHPLSGSPLPLWPAAIRPSPTGASCSSANCSIQTDCGVGTIRWWDGRCVAFAPAVCAIVLPILAAGTLVAGLAVWIARQNWDNDFQNVLLDSELQFNEPPLVLGIGVLGTVFLAEYRGSPVAVKVLNWTSIRLPPSRQFSKTLSSLAGGGGVLGSGLGFLSGSTLQSVRDDSDLSISGYSLALHRLSTFSPPSPSPASLPTVFEPSSGLCPTPSGGSPGAAAGLQHPGRTPLHPEAAAAAAAAPIAWTLSGSQWPSSSFRGEPLTTQHVDRATASSGEDHTGSVTGGVLAAVPKTLSRIRFGDTGRQAALLRDVRQLARLRHPWITSILGVVPGNFPKVVMEFMQSGCLKDVLRNRGIILDLEEQLGLLTDICKGMRFLHESSPPVVHGDIESGCVLLDSNFRAKMSGMLVCRYKDAVILPSGQAQRHHAVGSPAYLAPELLRDELGPTTESDIYAFGVLACEIFLRNDPYDGQNMVQVMMEVQNRALIPEKRPTIPSDCPPLAHALIQECWHADPLLRPDFAEVDRRLRGMDLERMIRPVALRRSTECRMSTPQAAATFATLLPPRFASGIAKGERVEPEHKEMVTVYFSDIVGFTDISSSISSGKVTDMLDRLCTRFDALADKFGVFKLETIGDAYLAVTNLMDDMEGCHASALARFALGAMEAAGSVLIDEDDPGRGTVHIRIGLASGPVTATILGTRNRKFTLLGDTMNTASRMESTSLPDRIQCTKPTARLIRRQDHSIQLESRGTIEVKGKGSMKTFWITGFRDAATAATGALCVHPNPSSHCHESVRRASALSFSSVMSISSSRLPSAEPDQSNQTPSSVFQSTALGGDIVRFRQMLSGSSRRGHGRDAKRLSGFLASLGGSRPSRVASRALPRVASMRGPFAQGGGWDGDQTQRTRSASPVGRYRAVGMAESADAGGGLQRIFSSSVRRSTHGVCTEADAMCDPPGTTHFNTATTTNTLTSVAATTVMESFLSMADASVSLCGPRNSSEGGCAQAAHEPAARHEESEDLWRVELVPAGLRHRLLFSSNFTDSLRLVQPSTAVLAAAAEGPLIPANAERQLPCPAWASTLAPSASDSPSPPKPTQPRHVKDSAASRTSAVTFLRAPELVQINTVAVAEPPHYDAVALTDAGAVVRAGALGQDNDRADAGYGPKPPRGPRRSASGGSMPPKSTYPQSAATATPVAF